MKNFIVLKGKKIELSDEIAERLCEELKEDIIYTPENIVFEEYSNKLWLHFNTDRMLGFGCNGWVVTGKLNGIVKTKLTPCKREDLKARDFAFGSNKEKLDFTDKEQYCLIIDDNKYRYVSRDEDVGAISGNPYKYWWKVEVAE
jgi:hypothetical protein